MILLISYFFTPVCKAVITIEAKNQPTARYPGTGMPAKNEHAKPHERPEPTMQALEIHKTPLDQQHLLTIRQAIMKNLSKSSKWMDFTRPERMVQYIAQAQKIHKYCLENALKQELNWVETMPCFNLVDTQSNENIECAINKKLIQTLFSSPLSPNVEEKATKLCSYVTEKYIPKIFPQKYPVSWYLPKDTPITISLYDSYRNLVYKHLCEVLSCIYFPDIYPLYVNINDVEYPKIAPKPNNGLALLSNDYLLVVYAMALVYIDKYIATQPQHAPVDFLELLTTTLSLAMAQTSDHPIFFEEDQKINLVYFDQSLLLPVFDKTKKEHLKMLYLFDTQFDLHISTQELHNKIIELVTVLNN